MTALAPDALARLEAWLTAADAPVAEGNYFGILPMPADLSALLAERKALVEALGKAHGTHLSNGTVTLDFHEDEDAAGLWNLIERLVYASPEEGDHAE